MEQFDHLLRLVRSDAKVVQIASFEWERVRGLSIGLANELKLPLHIWSSSGGMMLCDAEGTTEPVPGGPTDPIGVMRELKDGQEKRIVLIEDAQPYLKSEHHEVLRWILDVCRLPNNPRRVLLLSTPMPGLPVELHKEVPTLELSLPKVEELRVVCNQVATDLCVPTDQADVSLLEAARGLTVMEAKLAFGQAALQLGRLGLEAVPLVMREKERVIRQGGVLEYYEPDVRLGDVGGLENLKVWLERRGRAFGPGARNFGLDPPKGVLLLGVQGCGKSLVAKSIAATWRFPLLRFDLGKVFGGIVGQSEANIRNSLQVAQALAPCVLWIDEIEKGLSGLGSSDQSDAGTTARVVGTFLTWMQEKREPVFVVATANRIDLLPPELLRKGRFDEIFFVDLPTSKARKDIMEIHLKRKKRDPQDFDLEQLAQVAVGFSGAEIEEAIHEGLFEAFAEGRELRTENIESALRATYPLSMTMREHIVNLRRWAEARARLASNEDPDPLQEDSSGEVPRLKQESRNPFIPEAKT
ncbi:MAG: AAA family ATPase [Candidatus Brocadiia bacterium]